MKRLFDLAKVFFGFATLSGVGWLLDMATYSLAVRVFGVPVFLANFVSSYVGVTFVWFTSLKTVFKQQGGGHSVYLPIYWGFQFFSILIYSQLLHLLTDAMSGLTLVAGMRIYVGIIAKIVITPFNLVTNFIFMKLLVRFMLKAKRSYV